ncbi:LOW QUALITY PROTEIN: hypothetical protein YC2023_002681 [Brassica napus]
MGIEPSASPKSLNPIENLEKRDKNRDEEQWRSDNGPRRTRNSSVRKQRSAMSATSWFKLGHGVFSNFYLAQLSLCLETVSSPNVSPRLCHFIFSNSSSTSAETTPKREAKANDVYQTSLRTEAEARVVNGTAAELDQIRSDRLAEDRQKPSAATTVLNGKIAKAKAKLD